MIHLLEHVLLHTIEETLKLIPFLFITYLGMEYLENRTGDKTITMLSKTGKKGPVFGGLFGVIPQCGFSAAAANLYSGGVITVGTMVAVFLSTSDEMLPILISGRVEIQEIFSILITKVLVGIAAGLFVDYMIRRMNNGGQKGLHIREICEREHCHCDESSIWKPAIIHTVHISSFIFAILLAINLFAEWFGMKNLVAMAVDYPLLGIFFVGLLGMIPNCAVSVAITTFYLEGVLSFGSMFAGLLACSGMGIVILFKMNPNWKKNVTIVAGIYGISVLCGILLEFLLV